MVAKRKSCKKATRKTNVKWSVKSYRCKKCGNNYPSKAGLDYHMKWHKGGEKFEWEKKNKK